MKALLPRMAMKPLEPVFTKYFNLPMTLSEIIPKDSPRYLLLSSLRIQRPGTECDPAQAGIYCTVFL
jgi:hypothetical protein